MIINSDTLQAMSLGFSNLFEKTFKSLANQSVYMQLATIINTPKNPTITYGMLSDIPSMREWIGDRVINNLRASSFSITKKDFEATIGVSRDDILFDQLNIVRPKVEGLAESGHRHYDELIFDLISQNGNCFDESPFFGDHSIKDLDDNEIATFTNTTDAKLSKESVYDAKARMQSIISDTGRPLMTNLNTLVVSPNNEGIADYLINSQLIEGTSNQLYKKFKVIVSPYFKGDEWALFDTTKALKPFILQITRPITFTPMTNPQDESVFTKKEFRYGIDSMDNGGYGLPHLAFFSDGTA